MTLALRPTLILSILFPLLHPELVAGEAQGPRIAVTSRQMEALRKSLSADPDAARAFAPVRKLADRALQESPNPVKAIFSEGRLYTDPQRKQSLASRQDLMKMEAVGYVYGLTGKPEYGAKARTFVLSWARTYEPDGNPINETEFTRLIKAYDLTGALFSGSERLEMEKWFRRMAEKEKSTIRQKSSTLKNNHHSHRLKIIGHIAFLLPDPELVAWVIEQYKRHLEVNLNPDGTTYDFHERDALHYHTYSLQPLVELAMAADRNGADLYGHSTSQGANLEQSIAFLIPYILGEKEHWEFVRSTVKFDLQRSSAGDPNIQVGEKWRPQKAKPLFDLAGYFNPRFHQVPFPGDTPAASFERLLSTLR